MSLSCRKQNISAYLHDMMAAVSLEEEKYG